jgi:hypothetical protein
MTLYKKGKSNEINLRGNPQKCYSKDGFELNIPVAVILALDLLTNIQNYNL